MDAAYAGSALICDEFKHYSKMFKDADFFVVNFMKWMLSGSNGSLLFVKDRHKYISSFTGANA